MEMSVCCGRKGFDRPRVFSCLKNNQLCFQGLFTTDNKINERAGGNRVSVIVWFFIKCYRDKNKAQFFGEAST